MAHQKEGIEPFYVPEQRSSWRVLKGVARQNDIQDQENPGEHRENAR
jgi:hypothetical protein